ncbi:unnamed protein product [Durusdinium trenchii]|uniref:Fibronectin type-III domain-containing protein n=1 Tax=Durusdinium trenchii TaxID=1381693 RepID=A0ABP0PJT0_9DINO
MCGMCTRCVVCVVLFNLRASKSQDDWPTCSNREFRDDEVEPGGLKLLGVKESPLGFFPHHQAAMTHEHFFQQLREVLTDDCPRIFVEVALQPAAGPMMNWSSTSLWLRYFHHSGMVLAIDPVNDFLKHHADALQKEPWVSATRSMKVEHMHASLGTTDGADGQATSKEDGGRADSQDEVRRLCETGPAIDTADHPWFYIRRRDSWPQLDFHSPTLTFDTIWKRSLGGKHIDFLDIGSNFARLLKGFSKSISARAFTVIAFQVNQRWTRAELQQVVAYLDKFEYFSMFPLVCKDSSQVGTFDYYGPGGEKVGPTTYLPVSSTDINVIDWEKMPFPQDVISLDLRQPEIFKIIQLGDAQCDSEDDSVCGSDDEQCRAGDAATSRPPERPQLFRVSKSGSRSITLEWRPHPDGPTPDSYLLRLEPGALEETIDHDTFDALSSLQSYTINGLRPSVEYTISLRALGIGGESSKVTLSHRTELEEVPSLDSFTSYDIIEGMHCGMGAAEEVQPAGPSPSGASYFPGVGDVKGCQIRCEGNRQCIAFQVHEGNACWLYRRKPDRRLGRSDFGWWLFALLGKQEIYQRS